MCVEYGGKQNNTMSSCAALLIVTGLRCELAPSIMSKSGLAAGIALGKKWPSNPYLVPGISFLHSSCVSDFLLNITNGSKQCPDALQQT